jgi:hypothetical protein
MARTFYSNHERLHARCERPCWREMLLVAMAGLYPSDQQLEHMLDHLERLQ